MALHPPHHLSLFCSSHGVLSLLSLQFSSVLNVFEECLVCARVLRGCF